MTPGLVHRGVHTLKHPKTLDELFQIELQVIGAGSAWIGPSDPTSTSRVRRIPTSR